MKSIDFRNHFKFIKPSQHNISEIDKGRLLFESATAELLDDYKYLYAGLF